MKVEDIHEHVAIDTDGQYVVLRGSKLWIFKTDGTFVACRPDLKNTNAVLFLSDNTAFVEGGMHACHLISLIDGSEIWSCPMPKPIEYTAMKLVSSTDQRYIYTFYEWHEKFYLVTIDLQQRELYVCKDTDLLHATKDIACDENGNPCLLKSVYREEGDHRVGQNGIEVFRQTESGLCESPAWKSKWEYQNADLVLGFLDSTDTVITQQLMVHNLKTDEKYYLLENETEWTSPSYPASECWKDLTGRYLTLRFWKENVVVDVQKRSVAATYPGEFVWGKLIGNEYWTSVGKCVERQPFPSCVKNI